MNNDLHFALRGTMKLLCRASLLAAIAAISLHSSRSAEKVPAVPTAVTTVGLTPGDALADFDFMRGVLEEAHPGLDRYSMKAELDHEFAVQRKKLRRPMSKSECFEVFAESLALIKCGHTGINPDGETIKAFKTARLFPLQVVLEGPRMLVKSNETPRDQVILPGMEVLEINGRKVSDLLNQFQRLESADGDIKTSKRVHIQRGFSMYYWFLIEQPVDFTVKARNAVGVTVEAKLAGVTRDQLGKSQNPVNATMKASLARLDWSANNLSLRFLKGPSVAELRIPSFTADNFQQWIENTFKTLHEKDTKVLIIDLRGNGGGRDMNGALLVSCLTDKPFRYFDRITAKTIEPTFKAQADWSDERTSQLRQEVTPNPLGGYLVKHPGMAEQAPGKYPFLGKVIVLIDGGVFSTAADFCAVTHHLRRATFIGEETGGGYCGNNSGSFAMVTLPNSKFEMRLPLYAYWNAVSGSGGNRKGTLPDHVVVTQAANLLRGVDEQLDLALTLAAAIPNEERK